MEILENMESASPARHASGFRCAGSDERDFSKEFTMPDYIPDIKKVVSAAVKSSVEETGSSESRRDWECDMNFTVLLLCDDGTLHSVSLAGRQNGDLRCDACADEIGLTGNIENLSVRASDPRRLTARCRVCVRAFGKTDIPTEAAIDGTDGSYDEMLEKKLRSVEYSIITPSVIYDARASADLELGQDEAEIDSIVQCRVCVAVTGTEVNGGKATVRGDAYAEVIYSDIDGRYHTHTARIPISAETDAPDGAAIAYARGTADEIKASAQSNSNGEQKLIELDFSWNADIFFVTQGNAETVADMYSVADKIELRRGTIRPDRLAAVITEKTAVKGESSSEDLLLSRAIGLEAFTAGAEVSGIKRLDDGSAEIFGTVNVCLICETDDENEPNITGEIRIPFSVRRECGLSEGAFEYRADAAVTGCRVDLSGAKVTAEADTAVSAIIWQPFDVETVQGGEKIAPEADDRAQITLYYSSEGDDPWEVCKKYGVRLSDLLEENGVNEQELKGRRVIVIPQRKAEASFSRVI